MIEFCSPKRMFATVVGFLGISVFVIFMEDYFTDHDESFKSKHAFAGTSTDSSKCWNKEEYSVVEACVLCSEFELKANIKPCIPSGYYDIINCTKSGILDYRSCFTNVNLEEKRFFIFFLFSACFAVLCSSVVYWRQRQLDRQMFEKIQRQLGEGM